MTAAADGGRAAGLCTCVCHGKPVVTGVAGVVGAAAPVELFSWMGGKRATVQPGRLSRRGGCLQLVDAHFRPAGQMRGSSCRGQIARRGAMGCKSSDACT